MERWVELVSTFFGYLGLVFLTFAGLIGFAGRVDSAAVAVAFGTIGGILLYGGYRLWKERPRQ